MPWADEAEQQLCRIAFSACELSAEVHILGVGLPEESGMDTKVRWTLKVARQASSTSLCASVRAVPWADEAEQQLSRLANSACELSADVRILEAGLTEDPGMDSQSYI